MDFDVLAWALGGFLLCFCTGFGAGVLHKGILRLAESITA
jgi:hypothetical protein